MLQLELPASNPYQSPRSEASAAAALGTNQRVRLSLGGVTLTFPVGSSQVEIYLSNWSGREIYKVDGETRLDIRDFRTKGIRRLAVGKTKPDMVEMHHNTLLLQCCRVLVNGRPYLDDVYTAQDKIHHLLLIAVPTAIATMAFLTGAAAFCTWVL